MPIMKCTLKGKSGYKWGAAGRCFTGPTAEEEARKQGVAVLYSEARASGAKSKDEISAYISRKAATELKKA